MLVTFSYEIEHNGLMGWPDWAFQYPDARVVRSVFVVDVPVGFEMRAKATGIDLSPTITERKGRHIQNGRPARLSA